MTEIYEIIESLEKEISELNHRMSGNGARYPSEEIVRMAEEMGFLFYTKNKINILLIAIEKRKATYGK